MDSAGSIYGTTAVGGTGCVVQGGCGTLFKIDSAGSETIVSNFLYKTGWSVGPSLLRDAAGNFFGITTLSQNCCGSVYEVTGAGTHLLLHNFPYAPNRHDGVYPEGLIRDAAGNFYGTTENGGAYSYGTVFKIDTSGKETVLYSFTGGADGGFPLGGLVRDMAGNLYGTTSATPLNSATRGTVFELTLP